MDRLFLDANVLFSAAYRPGAGVARLWSLEGCEVISSAYVIDEARRNLTAEDQLGRLADLLQRVLRVPTVSLAPELRGTLVLPEKDGPILGGAVAAQASHLLTGDRRDFGSYFGKVLFGVTVLPPSEYLATCKRRAL